MKQIRPFYFYITLFILPFCCKAQKEISQASVERIISVLSADSLEGRKVFTPGNEKAITFIKNEFQSIGLNPLEGRTGFEDTFSITLTNGEKMISSNIIGVLPGRSKPDQYLIFSAHFDHIGIITPVNNDSIANGADDDASGVAAVIELARYFANKKNNEVSLIFAAFNAEEIGIVGSSKFAAKFNPANVVAMINIEMIGKEAKFGKNTAFLTGFNKSNLGKILQKNLKGTGFTLHPDPYPEQDLFYRSDNAAFAKLGVPAHTFSTDQIDSDTYYHSVDDEIGTLSIVNITNTIQGIIDATTSIVEGKEVPTRVKGVKR